MSERRERSSKRNNPDYMQASAYIPRALRHRVEHLLIGDSRDYSDLIRELLTEWADREEKARSWRQ